MIPLLKPDDPKWIHCPTCAADRERANLERGRVCGLCGTDLIAIETPALREKARLNPKVTDEDVELAAAAVAQNARPKAKPKRQRTSPAPTQAAPPEPAPAQPPVAPQTTSRERNAEVQAQADEAFAMPYVPPQATVEQEIERELAYRVLARRRLMPFIRRFRPKYLPGWAHEDICRRLERFVEQVERGESPRLLILCPPRMGKSEIGSRNFPPWVLGKHPDWEIIAASHTSSLTMSFSRYIRDLMRDPAYGAVFPDTRLDPSSQSVENWNLTSGGGYLAAGVGTGITGRGAHVLVIDDVVKDIEAADSSTIRDNTWEWYLSTAYTRLAPGGGVLGILTWWHDDDWAGRIQQAMETGEGDKFEIVRYPAINDQGDEYILTRAPGEPIEQILPGHPVPEGARLTRPMGTAIHPARYTTEMMLRIKKNLFAGGQQRVWNALYQQNPLPDDGILFTKEMFRYYGQLPDPARCHIYQAWDFAISEGKENDWTVGTTLYQDERDNLYVADVRAFKSGDSFVIIDEILDYAREWNATLLGFEDGQIWKAMEAVFERRCAERKQYPSFEILKPLTDKMVRASPLRGRMQLGKVFFPTDAPWQRDLYLELTRFPNVKHDDRVDSLAWAVRLTLSRSAPRHQDAPARGPKQKSWKSRLPGVAGGPGASHMSA